MNTLMLMVKRKYNAYKHITAEGFVTQVFFPPPEFKSTILDTFLSCCYPFFRGKGEPTISRLFKTVSFLNHSCNPNAELCWNETTDSIVLRATKNIAKGDEILVTYIDQFKNRNERHADLEFNCHCPFCSLTGEWSDTVETWMERLGAAFRLVDAFQAQYRPRTSDALEPMNVSLSAAIISNPRKDEVVKAANDIVMIMGRDLRMNQSSKSKAHELLYIVHASIALVRHDLVFLDYAFDFLLRQLEILGQCVGLNHPVSRDVQEQLLNLVAKDETKRQRLVASLESIGGGLVEQIDDEGKRWTNVYGRT